MFAYDAKHKLNSASSNVKGFVEDTIDIVSYANTETKELIKEAKQDFQNLKKELKNDVKDGIYKRNYKIGKFVDDVDRIAATTKNGCKEIRKIVKPNNEYDPIYKVLSRKKVNEYLIPSDHIKVERLGYTHHGIYIGDNKIIHFKQNKIQIGTLEEFQLDSPYIKIASAKLYPDTEIIQRAIKRVGEQDYNLFLNNCEHFVTWCRSGGRYNKSI